MRRLKIYNDTKQFWSEVSPHLRREETKNNLLLGLAQIYTNDPQGCLYQSALFERDKLLGSAMVSTYLANRNFLASPVDDSDTAKEVFAGFIKANLHVTGLLGEKRTANYYAQLFEKLGHGIKVNMRQALYRCVNVKVPPLPADVSFRMAAIADIVQVGEWIEAFASEAVPHDGPVDGKGLAKLRIENKMVFVLEQAGRIVSTAAWSRDLGSSCAINFVFTPPDLRGNGYGSLVTALLTKKLLEDGKREICLYTDLANPTANKIYQSVGYEYVCDSVHYGVT